MSLATIQVPSTYGYVVVASVIGCGFVTSTLMGSKVMEGRKKYNIPYPNLYAVPTVHDHADEFNRIQRGHQSYFELLVPFVALIVLLYLTGREKILSGGTKAK